MRVPGALWAGRVMLLALAFGIGTWILGWWAIPAFAAVAALLAREIRHQAVATGVAAAVAWAALLGWSATAGSVWGFARLAGNAMGISGFLLILITLAFPAALAWSTAAVVQYLARAKPGTN